MSKRTRNSRQVIGSNLSFNDLLFNILLGFVMLFVIAFLLINPITKKDDIPVKAEFLVVLEWKNDSADDVDLWVQRNDNNSVGFANKEDTPLHLDRDDLGKANDKIVIDGVLKIVRSNRETISMRGIVSGKYYVGVHYYTRLSSSKGPLEYTVTVMKVNPFKQLYSKSGTLNYVREYQRLPAFEVDDEGNVVDIFSHKKDVVPVAGSSAG